MYSIIQVNIPLSTPVHVQTAHAKKFHEKSPAQRRNQSWILPEPSVSNISRSCYTDVVYRSNRDARITHVYLQTQLDVYRVLEG